MNSLTYRKVGIGGWNEVPASDTTYTQLGILYTVT